MSEKELIRTTRAILDVLAIVGPHADELNWLVTPQYLATLDRYFPSEFVFSQREEISSWMFRFDYLSTPTAFLDFCLKLGSAGSLTPDSAKELEDLLCEKIMDTNNKVLSICKELLNPVEFRDFLRSHGTLTGRATGLYE